MTIRRKVIPLPQRPTCSASLWAICLLFALYTAWSALLPGTIAGGIDGLLGTVLLVGFALVHGSRRCGLTSILVFLVICLFVSNASENLSILTGFPFGHYTYTEVLGPKLFLVPVVIGGAYAGAGYVSWMVAHVLLDYPGPASRFAGCAAGDRRRPDGELGPRARPQRFDHRLRCSRPARSGRPFLR